MTETKEERRKHLKWWLRTRLLGNPLQAAKDVYWWVMHRTRKRFDRVKLRFLKPGYYDVDTRMIHAMFTLLSDFVEREKPGDLINWESDPGHSFAWKEIQDLYRWWNEGYLKRREPIHDVPDGQVPPLQDLNKTQEMYPVWHRACRETWELEKKWIEEDERQMIRLIKIHRYLWT